MTTALATKQQGMAVLEQVVIHGDLSKLSPEDRVMYYKQVCESVGLNPLTKPFEYINLNGKLRLYALRDATDQLRKLHNVSISISAREVVEDCYVVTAQATDKTGRKDESIGAVPIASLKGEFRSNAMMKAETKAKRRVTLSICGMGWLDESEVESIPGAKFPEQPVDAVVTPEQIEAIHTALSESNVELTELLAKAEIGDVRELSAVDAPKAIAWIRAQKPKKPTRQELAGQG